MGVPFSYAIDVWSVGVILCEAWLGHQIFVGEDTESIMESIVAVLGPLPKASYEEGKFYSSRYSSESFSDEAVTFGLDLNSEDG
jgi:hypothetical protein